MPDENLLATLENGLRQSRTTRSRLGARLADLEAEAERVRTVPAPGDEKERETRGEPQQKTEHIRPAAFCKRRNIILLRGGNLLSRQRKRVPLSRHILCCRMVNNK